MTPKRGPRAREMRPAGAAIADTLELYGISEEVRAGRVVTEWGELVGPKIAARARPDGIVDRTLWIEVANAAWMHELSSLRPQLLMGLVERLGQPRLFDDVRFRLAGNSRRPKVTVPRPRATAQPRPLPPPASGAARERIVREVAGIEDAELRDLIARVRVTHDR